jgi:transposase
MFLKRCARRKCGKEHVYWQLVESYRTARGSRHRVVAYLGELARGERAGWARLGRTLDGKAARKARQLSLFAPSEANEAEPVPDRVEVNLKDVQVARTRDFGDVFLGYALWRMLDLDDLFAEHLPVGKASVRWGLMACVLTIARFVEPSSELHVEDTWYGRTALADLLGIDPARANHNRLYRTLDRALPLKPLIERHLKRRAGELFCVDFDLLLYDVTSTYFEGEGAGNAQAQRGHSRDHRPDCKQVCIGLVVTPEGFPLGYEVFAGNRTDVTTVEEIVEAMEAKYGRARRIWVLDRGMVSEANLRFLRARQGRYVVGTPRRRLRAFEADLLDQDWREVQAGVEVKRVRTPGGEETFVLCRSADRRAKEKAMHERFAARIEEGLQSLSRRLAAARKACDSDAIERQIDRLLGRNTRAAGGFKIEVREDPGRPSGVRLRWSRDKAWAEWAAISEGCYLLRTNLNERTPEELWRTYIQLTDVEEAFRTQKSELHIRPIWHHREDRVQGHILFSFLAYVLWKTLQTWMERSGLGRGVRTLIEEFARIKATDVLLRTSEGRDIKLCCVTRPDKAQEALLQRLGLRLPERLGRPVWVPRIDETSRRDVV